MDISDLVWREGLRRGLRAKTIKTYIYILEKFFRTEHLEPYYITKQHREAYNQTHQIQSRRKHYQRPPPRTSFLLHSNPRKTPHD
jgi:hypothetical protein